MLKSEKVSSNSQPKMPTYGTQVTVQTESERQLDKIKRKEGRRGKRGAENGMGDFGVDDFSSLLLASERKQPFEDMIGTGEGESSFQVTSLPQGTTMKHMKGYEDVKILPTPTAPLKPNEKLIKIKELDDIAQAAFQGYESLNRVQSRIFQATYNTNENILVCAPTGAGKTNIAMIAVLHEVKQHFREGILHKNEFKIVYVAPMKALAAEVTATFGRRLSPLNLVVRELTGDMQLTKNEIEETQMIVTTPEKWDVITRKSSDMALSMLVKLIIIDEVHLLNDDRGSVIETLVAPTLRQIESMQSMIRIVGLSATLPTYLEVAQFLRVNPDTGLFYFDSSYRPVPLAQQYIGITERDYAKRNELFNSLSYEKVVESIKQGYQALVFVHTRKDTGKTARTMMYAAALIGCWIGITMKINQLTRKNAYIVVAFAALVLAGSTPVSSQDIPPEQALNLDVRGDSYVSFFNEAHELLQARTLPDASGHYFLPKQSEGQPEWWLTVQVTGDDPKRCAIKYYRSDNMYLVGVMNGDGTLLCTDDAAAQSMFPLGCIPLGFTSAYSDLSDREGPTQDLSTLLRQQTLGRTDAMWAAQILVDYGVTIHEPALAKKAFLIYALMVSEALRFRPIGELVKQNWLGAPVLTKQQSWLIFVWKDMSIIFCRGYMGTRSPRQLGNAQMYSVADISRTLDFVKGENQCADLRHEIPVPP